MARRTITMAASDSFVDELDQAVQRCQQAYPHVNYSRSAFMKSAISRAMAEVNAQYGAKPRSRERVRSDAAA